jgi:hypothetical protein
VIFLSKLSVNADARFKVMVALRFRIDVFDQDRDGSDARKHAWGPSVAQKSPMLMSKSPTAKSNKTTTTSPQETAITLSISPSTWVLDRRERPLAIAAKPALGEKPALVAIVTSVILACTHAA